MTNPCVDCGTTDWTTRQGLCIQQSWRNGRWVNVCEECDEAQAVVKRRQTMKGPATKSVTSRDKKRKR